MGKRKPTHLYVLSCGNRIKIGVTNNITQRIKTLQTGNPDKIELTYIEERYNPRMAETYLHREFASKRISGEWFDNITIHEIRMRLMMFHGQDLDPQDTHYDSFNI